MELNGDLIERIILADEPLTAAIFAAEDYVRAGFEPHDQLTHAIKAYLAAAEMLGVRTAVQLPPEPVSHPNQAWCDQYAEWYEGLTK